MRSIIPRPFLLALTLVLVAGVIAMIEFRLDAATPQTAGGSGETAAMSQGERKDESSREKPPKPDKSRMEPEQKEPRSVGKIERKEEEFRRAEEIAAPSGFINADNVSINEARGEKVVLLDFWTYSCYNCQNTQPFINRWHEKYAGDGLQIIGVHTPEFGFEREYANVERAVREAGIEYPVVLDNSYATWNAYDQRYWPAWYLIDADGFIRYKHFGEGAYGDTEAKIKELLAERDRVSN